MIVACNCTSPVNRTLPDPECERCAGTAKFEAPISSDEVVEQIRAVLAGTVSLRVERTWADVFAGEVICHLSSGWRIDIFNDCDSLDYVDAARAPDGREIGFDELYAQGDPTDKITPEEYGAFEHLLQAATVAVLEMPR